VLPARPAQASASTLLRHVLPAVTVCIPAGPADSQQIDHLAGSQCMSSSTTGAYTSMHRYNARQHEQPRRALIVMAALRTMVAAQVAGRPSEALFHLSWHELCLRDGGHQALAMFASDARKPASARMVQRTAHMRGLALLLSTDECT